MKQKYFTVSSRNGLKLATSFVYPLDAQHPPLVILLHGNTGQHITSLANDLAEHGIASLSFDAPGSGKSEGSWENDYRVTNYIDAVSDVYDYAINYLPINKERIGIWGHSMGGMVAVYAATKKPGNFKALCGSELSSGAMSTSGRNTIDAWKDKNGAKVDTEIFGTIWLPADYFLDRMQYKTIAVVENLYIPQLYIAGTRDDMVKSASVRAIFDAANDPKEYVEFDMDHFYKRDSNALKKVNGLTTEFFVSKL